MKTKAVSLLSAIAIGRITSYNVCYTKLLRVSRSEHQEDDDHQQHINERNQVYLGLVVAATALEVHELILRAALAVQNLDQTDGLLLHVDNETIYQRPEVLPENHARNGDQQTETGVVQSNGDTMRQLHGIASGRRLRAERNNFV